MIDYPRITIVSRSLNQDKYLEETMMSILEQDYPYMEYIVINS